MLALFSNLIHGDKLRSAELVVLDVDGVLTDGGLLYTSNGMVNKKFDVKDGLGIKILQLIGLEVAFLSGGKTDATYTRAKELGVEHCITEAKDKGLEIKKLQKELEIPPEKTIFLGDDINDLTVKNFVSLLIATKDAESDYKKYSDITLSKKGGNGALRELVNRIVNSKKINIIELIKENKINND